MKIQRTQILKIKEGIKLYDQQNLFKWRLTSLLIKNEKIVDDQMELDKKTRDKLLPQDEMTKYHEKRNELIKTYWKKDDKGEYEMTEGETPEHVFTKKGELEGKLQSLVEKNEKLFTRYNKAADKLNEMEEEKIELPLMLITDIEYVKLLAPKTLAALAPIVSVEIPAKILEQKGDALNTNDAKRIMEFCKIKEEV